MHLKSEKFQVRQFLSSVVFRNYILLQGPFLQIFETKFSKLIFHLQLSYQIPADISQEFFVH